MKILPGLTGIIACGGKSSRMGFDKSMIAYTGIPHAYYLYELLSHFCDDVYLSHNQTQNFDNYYKQIPDLKEYVDRGPVTALLTAISSFPGNSIMLIGCDYAHITLKEIEMLVENRKLNSLAICFKNESGIHEPMPAIYECDSHFAILERFNNNKYSLREFLEYNSIVSLVPDNYRNLKSIDQPNEIGSAIQIKL